MKILYLGEMGDAIFNLIAFSEVADDIVVINTSLTDFYDEPPGVFESVGKRYKVHNLYESGNTLFGAVPVKLKKPLRYIRGLHGASIPKLVGLHGYESRSIRRFLKSEQFDVVFAAWGIGVIPDIHFLREFYPDIPIVHSIPTFPTSQKSRLRELLELFIFRRSAAKVQGFVVGSERMRSFVARKFGLKTEAMFVGPIYYSSEYFAKKKAPLLSSQDQQAHLVFPGTNDFSKSYNDVSAQIIEVADQGIHVYCGKTERDELKRPFVHFYERYDTPDLVNGKFAEYMTQFDGCLVLYNGNRKRMKMEHSVPQRFLAAFTAGIPIFMKRGTFRICEEIVSGEGIGLVYNNAAELKECLEDRERMKGLRSKALEVSARFSFDAQREALKKFFESVTH